MMRRALKTRIAVTALIAVAGLAFTACAPTARTASGGAAGTQAPVHTATHPGVAPTPMTHSMEEMEQSAVKAFPAKTAGVGGRVLQPRIVGGVKVFDITAKPVRWEVTPGQFIDGYGYNGQIPGPELRVRRGDRIKVVLRNDLAESTAIHFHGLTVPNKMDGVPFITQPPVRPGTTFTYALTIVDTPGTYMYHSHENATDQVGKGLLGPIVVEPSRRTWEVEHTMVIGDGAMGFTLNGKGFPATAPIVAGLNDEVLVRLMNAGQQLHPMHLHGFHFTVVGVDGRAVTPYVKDTIVVAPGERYDVLFTADQPGVWAFHCHVLPHVEGAQGMYGMVTAVVVQ